MAIAWFLPFAAYQSWKSVRLEGKGIEPDVKVDWSFEEDRRTG